MIARQFRINFRAPGVDSAAQTLDVFETMALEIGSRVHASLAMMIVNDEKPFPRPIAQALLHKLLREENCIRQPYGIEFLPGANVEQLNWLIGGKAIGEFTRFDLQRAIRLVTDKDVLDYFLDVQIFISCANAGQRFVGTESATAAPANMIATKQSALGSWKVFQEFSHRDLGIDGDRGIHVE